MLIPIKNFFCGFYKFCKFYKQKFFFTAFNFSIMKLTENKPLLCQIYRQNILEKHHKELNQAEEVRKSFDLTDVNHFFFEWDGKPKPRFEEKVLGMPLDKLVKQTDTEFELLKPTDRELIVWRGIPKPISDEASPWIKSLYQNAQNLKFGDILYMPEYAYSTDTKWLAEQFAQQNGIIYEITVPKKSKKISRGRNYIFHRYSRFICTGTKKVSGNVNYKLIKLLYTEPENISNLNLILNKVRKLCQSFFHNKKLKLK